MQKIDDVPRGQLSTIILSTLLENDKYGYEIINEVARKTKGKITIKQPSLYSSLRRMEEQSLISSYWRDSDIGGRRHYYSITDYGKKYIEKWQTDILSYNEEINLENQDHNKNDNSSSDSPTFLEQSNLFDSNKSNKPIEHNTINQEKDNSFIQYDLFTNPTFIAKPSVDIFETVKEKQQPITETSDNVDKQPSSQETPEDKIAKLRNTILENNQSNICLEPVNIKKEFYLVKKKQKSFTDSYKENITYNDFPINEEHQEVIEEKIDKTIINEANLQEFETSLFESNPQKDISDEISFINLDEEIPTIYQSTTEFSEPQQLTSEIIAEDKKDKDDISIESTKEQNLDSIPSYIKEKKDDAVFITEKPNPEDTPKVRKIAPARFEQINNYAYSVSLQSESKIKKLYETTHEEELIEQNNNYEYEQDAVERTEITDYSNYNQLKEYYNKNGISFYWYKKLPKSSTSQASHFIKTNKFNLISSCSLLTLIVLQSIVTFICCSQNQPYLWFFYIIPPIATLAYSIYRIVLFVKMPNTLAPSSIFKEYNIITNSVISIITILVIFSINLLCGMNFTNIVSFATSFIYLSILSLNFPIYSLIKFIIVRYNLAKA